MGKDRLLWSIYSSTSKLNTFPHLTDYGLSGHMVFDQGQIRPDGKMLYVATYYLPASYAYI